jgi:hypothetical protein
LAGPLKFGEAAFAGVSCVRSPRKLGLIDSYVVGEYPNLRGAISVPLNFHMEHGHRREVTEAELRVLRKTVRQVEQAEGLNLGSDEHDPRPKLRKLAGLLGQLRDEQSVATLKNLIKEWGMASPPALQVARQLNEVLELWSRLFVEKVGLVDAT